MAIGDRVTMKAVVGGFKAQFGILDSQIKILKSIRKLRIVRQQHLITTIPSSSVSSPAPKNQSTAVNSQAVDYDITIVGGGIVGLTLACALQESGLKIALVEARPREVGLSQRRAYALTLLTGRIFSGLGIWQQILPQITTFDEIRLADANCPHVVNLCPADLGTHELGYVAEHRVLLNALFDKLDQTHDDQSLAWLCPAEVINVDYCGDRVDLTIAKDSALHQIKTSLVVAADGSRSPMRQQAGLKTQGWAYWQSCVTAVIRPEQSHQNIAREHFWESGPFATLPLPDNRCQIVLTAPHAQAQELLEMDKSHFLAELNRRYGGQLGRIELEGDRALFPVKLMQSVRYVRPRLALIGDAAHSCHPVGGQGLNLGIRDAAALAQVLQAAAAQGEDLGDIRVLRRYERWRKLENWVILGFTDLLNRTFSNHWMPLKLMRRSGLWLMRRVRILKYLALSLMTGLSGRSPSLSQQQYSQESKNHV
jgi:2-octaprenyl-6-methoxyphenol hydroxylase